MVQAIMLSNTCSMLLCHAGCSMLLLCTCVQTNMKLQLQDQTASKGKGWIVLVNGVSGFRRCFVWGLPHSSSALKLQNGVALEFFRFQSSKQGTQKKLELQLPKLQKVCKSRVKSVWLALVSSLLEFCSGAISDIPLVRVKTGVGFYSHRSCIRQWW
jgi:hypothetical protein